MSPIEVDYQGSKSYDKSMTDPTEKKIRNLRARVAEKGQVVIPKALREQLGIRPGQVLEFSEDRGRLVAVKLSPESGVDSVYGVLGRLGAAAEIRSTDDYMNAIRGEPEPAPRPRQGKR